MGELTQPTRIRVVMVVRLFAPWIGGMERQALKLAAAMNRDGIADARIVTGRWFRATPREESVDGVPIRRHAALGAEDLRLPGGRTLGALVYMASLFVHLVRTRRTYDVIHVHGLSYHAAVCRLVSALTGRPMVVKLANSGSASDIVKLRRGDHLRGSRFLVPLALGGDRYVALNDAIVAELERSGVPGERIVQIPNGVPIPGRPRPAPEPDGPLRLVYAGRLHRQKSIETVLEAMARVAERSSSRMHLDVVGDGPERRELEAAADAWGVGSVTFHGLVDDVTPYLHEADALILPSRAEGLSNALLEAMALGVPGIVSDIPGNLAVVEDGATGLTFSAGNPQALAAVLQRTLDDRRLLPSLGGAARASIGDRFSITAVACRYASLYSQMTATSPPERAEGDPV